MSCGKGQSKLIFFEKDQTVVSKELLSGRAPLNFNSLKEYILKPKCFSCHSGADAKPENDPIDFTSYESTMIKRFVPLLKKGMPEKSRLYLSVFKGEMPVNRPLHKTEINFIKKWIEVCAPKESNSDLSADCNDDGGNDDGPGDDGPGDDDEPGNDEPLD